ncbi:MAG: hypothetical protein GXO79_11735 [Chlorobi bacterium]|nr:hypothetical protein [Chlorobiota bacterium]
MRKAIKYIVILMSLSVESFAQTFDFSGQLPLWTTINPKEPVQIQTGVRYIPEFSFKKPIKKKYSFDGELSVNSYITSLYYNDSIQINEKLKPYRIWIRFSTEQLEIRAGLQKINFGSAMILRPLMWFDKIDPRDPLQLTEGVYGILGKYYFLNNANIWLWGLLGNDELKGWEFYPSNKNKPEYGGRVQIPFFTGEIAGSFHHREIDKSNTIYKGYFGKDKFTENRYALDFKIDELVGLWFEGTINQKNIDTLAITKTINIGLDYTFNVGTGLSITSEFICFDNSNKISETGNQLSLWATSLNYSFNIINSVSGILYYDFVNNDLYRFLNFSWTYDKWNFYAIAFWNPDKFQIYSNLGEVSLYTGYGFQLMAVFNH